MLPAAQVTYAGETFIIYETDAFRSGIIAMLLLLPIVLPMRLASIRKMVSGCVSEWVIVQADRSTLPKYTVYPTPNDSYTSKRFRMLTTLRS